MRIGGERHRSCAALRFQTLNDCQFVWRFFSRDYCRAVSARGEGKLACVVKRTAIDAGANWNSVNNLSAFGIEDHHHFVVAAREQTMMRSIQRDSTWFFSRSERPVPDDFMFIRIDHCDFALVFDVAVNSSRFFIYRGEFWISSKRDGR